MLHVSPCCCVGTDRSEARVDTRCRDNQVTSVATRASVVGIREKGTQRDVQ